MKSILDTVDFLARTLLLFLLSAFLLVGYSCVKHGDVGPYPEADYIYHTIPVAALLAYLWKKSESAA